MWKWNPPLKDVEKEEIEEVYKGKECEDVKDSYEAQGKSS